MANARNQGLGEQREPARDSTEPIHPWPTLVKPDKQVHRVVSAFSNFTDDAVWSRPTVLLELADYSRGHRPPAFVHNGRQHPKWILGRLCWSYPWLVAGLQANKHEIKFKIGGRVLHLDPWPAAILDVHVGGACFILRVCRGHHLFYLFLYSRPIGLDRWIAI